MIDLIKKVIELDSEVLKLTMDGQSPDTSFYLNAPLMPASVQRSACSAMDWIYAYNPAGSCQIPADDLLYNVNNCISCKLVINNEDENVFLTRDSAI